MHLLVNRRNLTSYPQKRPLSSSAFLLNLPLHFGAAAKETGGKDVTMAFVPGSTTTLSTAATKRGLPDASL